METEIVTLVVKGSAMLTVPTDLSVFKQYKGKVHGAHHNLTFILLIQYTSNAHKIQQRHSKIKFLYYKY